jgi:hypothetical protein
MNMIFGEPWDAPFCDDAARMPNTPTHARCINCREQFAEGDQGVVMPMAGATDFDPDYVVARPGTALLIGYHRECQLVGILGHIVGVCPCNGWDTSTRAAGREALRRLKANRS